MKNLKKENQTPIKEGDKFNMLVVTEKLTKGYWMFLCDCGNRKKILLSSVKSGHTKSCGCLRKNQLKKKHGLSGTLEYISWCSIKERCYNSNNTQYKDYGGRGIVMSNEWKNSPEQFVIDMGLKPSKNYSIERIDNNLGYCKENCKWATRKEQQNNRRTNVLIEYKDEIKSVTKWCEELNLSYKTIEGRLRRGWSSEEAFEIPINKIKRLNEEEVRQIKTFLSEKLSYTQISKIFGIDPTTVGVIARGEIWKHII